MGYLFDITHMHVMRLQDTCKSQDYYTCTCVHTLTDPTMLHLDNYV